MINIGHGYYLAGDPLNITLYKEREVKKEGKTKGTKTYKDNGNYNTTQELLDALTRKKIRLDFSVLDQLEKIAENERETHQMIKEFMEKYGKQFDEMAKGEKK